MRFGVSEDIFEPLKEAEKVLHTFQVQPPNLQVRASVSLKHQDGAD